MMEVKQNTAVDLNELLVPPKTPEGTDELDDAIMADLSDKPVSQDLNCDLIKANEKSNNVLVVSNGDEGLSSLMDIDASDATDLEDEAPVSTEMEDVLLAEDDVLPNVNANTISIDASPSIDEDELLADKVETSNSTTCSSNGRDPGDDLDTLLSKINDIVDDCLDNEGSSGVIPVPEEISENANIVGIEEKQKDATPPLNASCENLDESVMFVEDPTDDDENNVESNETQTAEEEKEAETVKETNESPELAKTDSKITEDEKSEAEDKSVEQQSETLEKTIEEDKQPEVPLETTSEQPENAENHIEDITSEDEQTKECVANEEDKSPEASKDTTTDIEKGNEEASCPKVEEHITIADTEDGVKSLEATKNNLSDDREEPIKRDKEEKSNKEEEAKVVSLDIKEKDKENEIESEDATLVKPKEIVDEVTKPPEDVKNDETTGKTEASTIEETKNNDKVEHEDSDDEIVFYVDDKPSEAEKQSEAEAVKATDTSTEVTSTQTEENADKTAADDDDVVILDDDDEGIEETDKKVVEEPQKDITTENKSPSKANETEANEKTTDESIKDTAPKHSTNLDMDNSDNARDDFVTDKVPGAATASSTTTSVTCAAESEKQQPQETEETNSNCSSSSNLLLEAKTNENSADGANQEDNDNDNEEDDDDGDVELIENESKEEENSSEKGDELSPPAKRQRLSEDSQVSSIVDETSNKSQKPTETVEEKSETQVETTPFPTPMSLKRSHDVIELELDDKSNDSKVSTTTETLTKKARTEDKPKEEEEVSAEAEPSEVKALKVEEEDNTTEEKPEFKNMIPSYKPIPLYPPPKLETLKSETTFSLDFLKKFRKSFDKMTKQDLEEMVLQKVVEAIIHKSEFADMRDLIEKQEKLISTHRTKITELSKQFRDLEMVHNRVVKDIEQRNSQFIMPVKITRAVGLQVYIPNKKSMMDSGTTSSPGSTIIPASSPQRPHSAASLTSPQRPLSSASSQTADAQSRSGALSSAVNVAITNAVRRGCAQKITPTRPVPSSSSSSAPNSATAGAPNTTVYRSNLNLNQTPAQPRILNKNATPSSAGVGGANASANAANMQRNRYIPSNLESMRLQQQQAAASRPAANSQRAIQQPKPAAPNTTVPRRSDPAASTTSANNTSSLDSYMNTLSQLTGGNTAVSITPAKPKEKAVIDLTDEDEIAPAPGPAASTTTSNTTAAATNNGPAAANQPQRRSLPPQTNNTNSSTQFSRNAPPLARVPPINQMSNSNKNRQTPVQGQKSTNSTFSSTISTPPGTSITRINVAANTQNPQRVKYSHPAPLPATPPQAFNPSWKLPPPRPTIRISNLDNGIVISWTMEESMDRHAECVSYQIYAYQETSGPPMADSWRHVGDVKAMLLPMAVTLTQFQEGQRYFFAVRAVDCHQRYGPFSLPKTWS